MTSLRISDFRRLSAFTLRAVIALTLLTSTSCSSQRERVVAIQDAMVAPDGKSFVIWTTVADQTTQLMFMHLADREMMNLGRESEVCVRPVYAATGQLLAWGRTAKRYFGTTACRVVVGTTGKEPFVPRDLPLTVRPQSQIAISPSGKRLAVFDGTELLVADAQSGKEVARSRVPRIGLPPAVVFSDEDHLRLYPQQRQFREANERGMKRDLIREFDVATQRLSLAGEVSSDFPGLRLRPSSDATLLLALDRRRTIVTLRDGRSGTLLAQLPTDAEEVRNFSGHPRGKLRTAAFLSDGVAAILNAGGSSTLRTYSRTGTVHMSLDITVIAVPSGDAAILGQPAPHMLVVALNAHFDRDDTWQIFAIDLGERKVRLHKEGLTPLMPRAFWSEPTLFSPSDQRWRYFIDHSRSLVELDCKTGRTTPLVTAER